MVRRNYVKSPILEVGSKAEYGINLVEIRVMTRNLVLPASVCIET